MFGKKKIMEKKENLFKIGDIVRHKTEEYGGKMLITGVGQMTTSEGTQNMYATSYSRNGQIGGSYICEDTICLVEDLKTKK